MAYGVPGYIAAELKEELDHVQHDLEQANRRCEQLENLLNDLRDYFEQRADADHNGNGFVANEEMRISMRISEEL